MTKDERQQSLTSARAACHFLRHYIQSQIVDDRLRAEITCLLDEFERLDEKEQLQAAQGVHGDKGGRPRKTKQRRTK